MGKQKDSKQYKTRTQLLEENAQLRQEISELNHEITNLRKDLMQAIKSDDCKYHVYSSDKSYPISGIDEIP